MSNWKHEITGIDWSKYNLADREALFQNIVKSNGYDFDQPPYAIVWEDPSDFDAPVKVTNPSPAWWAMALHGGILPPVEVYHELRKDEESEGFTRHTRGYLLHDTPPVGPMTKEEAMEYLVKKDIPTNVWKDYKGNRKVLRIVPRSLVPKDRRHRNSWRIAQEEAV